MFKSHGADREHFMFQELTEKPWCWNQTRAEMSRGWPTQSWRRFVAFVLRPVERLKGLSKGVTREKKTHLHFGIKTPGLVWRARAVEIT